MATQPVIVGDVYAVNGIGRLKMSMSYGGAPLTGQTPTVTIVRDSDNYALDFTLGLFVTTTPAGLNSGNFKMPMAELGQGSYYWDFNPTAYGQDDQAIYTVIFRNENPMYMATTHDEFLFTDRFEHRFGLLDRFKQVCLNSEITIGYRAMPNQSNVRLNMYDRHGNLVVANESMTELSNTGIYLYKHVFTLAGEYIVIVDEGSSNTTDAMIITAGELCDVIKRIDQHIGDLLRNPPTVGPC